MTLKNLTEKHYKAAKMFHEGSSHKHIAEKLGVSKYTVDAWHKNESVKEEIERLQKEEHERTRSELDEAAEFQAEIRDDTRRIYRVCYDKIATAIDDLDSTDMRQLSVIVRSFSQLAELAVKIDQETLGLQQLSDELDAL